MHSKEVATCLTALRRSQGSTPCLQGACTSLHVCHHMTEIQKVHPVVKDVWFICDCCC